MNITEQDIITNLKAIANSHKPKVEFKYGPFNFIVEEDLTIQNSLCFVSPTQGGGDNGAGQATYTFQVFVVTKTTERDGSVEKAFTQSETFLNRILNRYQMVHPKHRAGKSNRQRINPGQLKSNAVGFVQDFEVTVPAPFSSSDFE